MTKKAFIEMLAQVPDDAIVRTFDPDMMDWMPVTGMVYGPNKERTEYHVDLYTDEP